jgi:hypothetical protein
MAKEFRIEGNGDSESLDNNITRHIKETEDIDIVVEKIQAAITTSCKTSFTTRRNTNKTTNEKSVPWWTAELAIKRKRLKTLRRCY